MKSCNPAPHPDLLPPGKNWHPKKGELVLTTPVEPEGFSVLTRLEQVMELEPRIVTASGREFYPKTLLTTDACSIDYGRMKMEKATQAVIKDFYEWQAKEAQALDLIGVLCEEYIRDLDTVERNIFREAMLKVARRRRPGAKEEPSSLKEPVAFYYIRDKDRMPGWIPFGTDYIYETASGDLWAVDEVARETRFLRPPVFGAALEHGILKHSLRRLTKA